MIEFHGTVTWVFSCSGHGTQRTCWWCCTTWNWTCIGLCIQYVYALRWLHLYAWDSTTGGHTWKHISSDMKSKSRSWRWNSYVGSTIEQCLIWSSWFNSRLHDDKLMSQFSILKQPFTFTYIYLLMFFFAVITLCVVFTIIPTLLLALADGSLQWCYEASTRYWYSHSTNRT